MPVSVHAPSDFAGAFCVFTSLIAFGWAMYNYNSVAAIKLPSGKKAYVSFLYLFITRFLNNFHTISLQLYVYMEIHTLTTQQCPLGIHQTDREIGSKRSLQKIENDIR